ncbi:MAG: DNA primase, partial [Thermomonas sp.]
AQRRAQPAQKPSLVRSAITHLLHRPGFALELAPPYRFAALRQPGIDLLSELVLLVRERPDITTGVLLEHFADRDDLPALQKLALVELPGEDKDLRVEFLDAIAQLDRQVLQQRIEELQELQRSQGLGDAEKQELRELLQARLQR